MESHSENEKKEQNKTKINEIKAKETKFITMQREKCDFFSKV